MGLDVTAHRNVKISEFENYEQCEEFAEENLQSFFKAFVIDDSWMDRISDLEADRYYIAEESQCGISYSCSYHNYMRMEICKMIGQDEKAWIYGKLAPKSYFEEWLNFADNEGCISATTCKKLYGDFKKWHKTAKLLNKDWLIHYGTWMQSFKFASENGAVEYH